MNTSKRIYNSTLTTAPPEAESLLDRMAFKRGEREQ